MLAGFGIALGHQAGQQRIVLREQRAQAAALGAVLDQPQHQGAHLAVRLGRQQAIEHVLDAAAPGAQLVDVEHHVHRHAIGLEVVVHVHGQLHAVVQQAAQVLGLLQHGRAALLVGYDRRRRCGEIAGGRDHVVRVLGTLRQFGFGNVFQQVVQVLGGARQLHESLGHLAAGAVAHAQAQLWRHPGGPHLAGQDAQRLHEGLAPAQRAVFGVAPGLAEQIAQALHGGVVQLGDPGRVAVQVEQQAEQGGQLARVRAGRQQAAAQALTELAHEGCAGREAVVGQQAAEVQITQAGGQQGHHAAPGLGVVAHVAHHVLHARHGLALADPAQHLDQPQVAFGRGALVRRVLQQGVDADGRAGA